MIKKLYTLFILLLFVFQIQSQTTNFNCTGGFQTYVVPAAVLCVDVNVQGAQGGGTNGGLGAVVTATLPVTPGQTLRIYVGCRPGGTGTGFNGGGSGQNATSAGDPSFGGGGASDIRISPYGLNDRIIVAGGGGGTGGGTEDGAGGDGGCANGSAGAAPFGVGGAGGTQAAGGAGGPAWQAPGNSGFDGSFAVGGAGAVDPCNNNSPGGGGGGGYYGGGGGGSDCWGTAPYGGGGGGGGSSLTPAGGACTVGGNTGAGFVSITPVSCTLPIDLVSFTGENLGHKNELKWITASEINNDYFTVQSSPNGYEPFTDVGNVLGAGNSNTERHYNLFDYNPFPKITYYRLKQVDYNGRFSLSNVIALKSQQDIEPIIYPNPGKDEFTLSFSDIINGGDISIHNAIGQLVYIHKIFNEKTIKINLDTPSGVYFIQIKSQDQIVTKKFFKE